MDVLTSVKLRNTDLGENVQWCQASRDIGQVGNIMPIFRYASTPNHNLKKYSSPQKSKKIRNQYYSICFKIWRYIKKKLLHSFVAEGLRTSNVK